MPRWRDRTLGSRISLGSALALVLSLGLYFGGVFLAPAPVDAIKQPFSWTDILLEGGGWFFLLSLAALLLGWAVSASEPPVNRYLPASTPPSPPAEPASPKTVQPTTLRNLRSWSAASKVLTFALVCFLLTIGLCGYGPGFDQHGTKAQELARSSGSLALLSFFFSLLLGLVLWAIRTGRSTCP